VACVYPYMKLYYHPRSSYSQKTAMAFHEKGVAFEPVLIDPRFDGPKLAEVTPFGKVPVLVLDDGTTMPESSIIIEYLDSHFTTGARLIPEDRDRARQTRFHDRVADLYVNDPMTKIAFDAMKPEAERDPAGVAKAHARLDAMFAGLDQHLAGRKWIMGDAFTLADCSLVPSLGYCRKLHPFQKWKNLSAYATRAFERPSFVKVDEELTQFFAKAG
jgi:glutathione S-transferase